MWVYKIVQFAAVAHQAKQITTLDVTTSVEETCSLCISDHRRTLAQGTNMIFLRPRVNAEAAGTA